MKLNKYWIIAIVGLLFVIVGGVVTTTNHSETTTESKTTTTNSSKKETDTDYAKKKFEEIINISKNSNVIIVLYEPGKKYTDTFLEMVKSAENNTSYSTKPEVVYFKGDSFVKNWINQGYAASSGSTNQTKNYLMKTNILVLKKGADISEIASSYELHYDQSDNDAGNHGGTEIDAPTGIIGIQKGLQFASGEVSENWLSKMETSSEVKNDIQNHVVDFAFSWFNNELYHRN